MAEQMKKERARRLFLIAFVLFTFANGFGGSIISNYFKGVYQVDSVQRGLLEIPRELPGVVGVFVIAALSGCGNLTLAMISFCLYAVGMFVLGLLSPGYLLMQLFVFTYSLGDHIVMPVRDAIAMDLADEGKTGTFLGKYRGYATMAACIYRVPVRGVLVPGGQIGRSVVLRVTCSRCGGVILPVETEKRGSGP